MIDGRVPEPTEGSFYFCLARGEPEQPTGAGAGAGAGAGQPCGRRLAMPDVERPAPGHVRPPDVTLRSKRFARMATPTSERCAGSVLADDVDAEDDRDAVGVDVQMDGEEAVTD